MNNKPKHKSQFLIFYVVFFLCLFFVGLSSLQYNIEISEPVVQYYQNCRSENARKMAIKNSNEFKQLLPVHQEMILRKANQIETRLIKKLQACWSPGENYETIQNFFASGKANNQTSLTDEPRTENFEFDDSDRWSTTATNGSGLGLGDPTTLTWSLVPDGVSIFGYNGESTAPNNLIAFLDGLYDPTSTGGNDFTQRAWFPFFTDTFDRWAVLTGFTYVYEPNDDGDPWTSMNIASGLLGVRGDVRIAGHSIDGQSGPNTLAYNFFPDFGDMVIDTDNSSLYGNTNGNSLLLRNVLSHEHGHGLGLSHSCPVEQIKLMEPFISSNFDGPQLDDILGANRGYGDNKEPNDVFGAATDLGTLNSGVTQTVTDISIDDNSDTDFIAFTTTSNATVDILLTPIGDSYLAGPQNLNGTCSSGTTFFPKNQSDLTLQLIGTDGTTIINTANNTGLGGNESILNESLPSGAGTYYVKVTGAQNKAQLYELSITVDASISCPDDLVVTSTTDGSTYKAMNTLTCSIAIPDNHEVIFEAGQSITLGVNFSKNGTVGGSFTARIASCSPFLEDLPSEERISKLNSFIELPALLLQPNPAREEVTINYSLPNDSEVGIQLFDIAGRMVQMMVPFGLKGKGQYQKSTEIGNLQGGMYFVIMRQANQVISKKLIIID